MGYLNKSIQNIQEIVDRIYTAFFGEQYAFAGMPNSSLDKQERENIGNNREESWLENVCFSHNGRKEGKLHHKGSSNLHHPSRTVGGIDITNVPEGESVKKFLLQTGMSEKKAKTLLKKHK